MATAFPLPFNRRICPENPVARYTCPSGPRSRPHGRLLKMWKFAGLPCGLLLGPDGQVYLATGFSGQILRLNGNGKAVAMMGRPGKGLGEFGEAHYLTISPGGDLYVADTINAVLHKYVRK